MSSSHLLNPAQREAVRHIDSPCLVLAGAGSGKTRVITEKIAHLVDTGRCRPDQIIAITFTNKAAEEMRERIRRLVSPEVASAMTVSTFHAFGLRLMRMEATAFGLPSKFSIFGPDDSQGVLQGLIASADPALIRRLSGMISLWKNAGVEPDDALVAAQTDDAHRAARVYRDYDATLRAYRAVDFDDLIGLPARHLALDAGLRERWQARCGHLLIDEYQDTNVRQYELVQQLVGDGTPFTAVGDDDQAIYAWRGATVDNLRRLQTDYPSLRVILLEQNYRSSLAILRAANTLIESNPKLFPKKLWSEHGEGDPVTVIPVDDDEAEAETVVMRMSGHRIQRRGRWSDYAILYRSNQQARIFEQALRRERIPYILSGGTSFFDRAEIRDLMAWLRLLVNQDDDPALIRAITTPRRGVGPTTLEALGKLASERHASIFETLFSERLVALVQPRQLEALREFGDFVNRMSDRAAREAAGPLLDELLAAIDYKPHVFGNDEERVAEGRWRNVTDFRDWLAKRSEEDDKSLAEVAQQAAIIAMIDRDDPEADAVRLTTIHASKGLEFPHVFIVGAEEGLIPHRGREEDEAEGPAADARIEDERRLMYVAVTRAQRTLHITWCRRRKRARTMVSREPSRFLREMKLDEREAPVNPDEVKNRLADLRAMLARPTAKKPAPGG
jgi:ATP-dependent DNA helicase Rep